MATIIDQYGNPIDRGALAEPQTSRIAHLENQYLTPMLDGLTPARLQAHLRAADLGDLTGQHRLFSDMEERDPHLVAEMGKRKNAPLGLDWDIVPPRNATTAEKAAAEWCKEVLTDSAVPFEDLVLALMDGIGHGFAAVEYEWRLDGGELLPIFHPRPQEWFRLSQNRRHLHLMDASPDGAPLVPFGWALHTHGTAKTGYLGRMGLHRCLVWPFIYKAYAVGDFAEFLETYGLPIIVGKYHDGASPDEKASLMRAVTALGHDARAIMPADMTLEVMKVAGGSGASGGSHLDMVEWADKAQSKAILGATLTSGADGASSTNALGKVHNEVRHDILTADAREIAATVTRDLIYPLIALNRGGIDSLRRCPRLVFDTGEAEDLALFAESLPKLVQSGMKTIPAAWVHEKLKIPTPVDGEAVLGGASPDPASASAPASQGGKAATALAALMAQAGGANATTGQTALDAVAEPDWQALMAPVLQPILDALATGMAPEAIVAEMAAWYPKMNDEQLTALLARALFLADTWGRIAAAGDPAT